MLDVYRNIKERRIALGLTQAELAKKIGYADKSTIAKIEAGRDKLVQKKIIALAAALDTTPGALMGWSDDVEPTPEECDLIRAYRSASADRRDAIKLLLGIKNESD